MKDGDLLLIKISMRNLAVWVEIAVRRRRLLEIILKGGR